MENLDPLNRIQRVLPMCINAIIIINQIINKLFQALPINEQHSGCISEQFRRLRIQFGNDKVPNRLSILSMEYYLKQILTS